MAVLFDFDWRRPAILNRIAKPVQRSHAWIASPGKHDPRGAPHADHLIVNDVGGHSDQGQASAPLPHQFVPRGKWDQMRESLERHGIAIAYQTSHRFPQ